MASRFRLDGKNVVITGGGRGIGAASAMACAEAGAASVALLARTSSELAQVAAKVEAVGARAQPICCDVTSPTSVADAFAQIGEIDVLVNGAGGNQPEPFERVTLDTYERLFALNVRAPFLVSQHGLRIMRASGQAGAIISISSQMGHVGAELRTVYCASKHALEGMMKALALELAPEGIRVMTVAPTFVRTAMTAAQLDDPEIGERLRGQIPLQRFGTVEDVACAVVYAASPAAALMTGGSLVIDGGWTAR